MQSVRAFLRQRPTGLLFHYTDAAGLIGIVERQELWASNALHLNDASEFEDAMSRFVSFTERRVTASSTFKDNWAEMRKEWETKGKRLAENIFVVSFSTQGNQLSQWRAYCPKGSGYSLGFSSKNLAFAESYCSETSVPTVPNTFLMQCIYDPSKQNELLHDLGKYIEFAWRRMKSLKKRYFAVSRIYRRMIATLLAIKHSGFIEENEWRLVLVFDDPPVFFRAGRFGITPFVKIPLCEAGRKMTLDKIFIGPNLDSDVAGTALKQLLTRYHIEGTQEECQRMLSGLPYRY